MLTNKTLRNNSNLRWTDIASVVINWPCFRAHGVQQILQHSAKNLIHHCSYKQADQHYYDKIKSSDRIIEQKWGAKGVRARRLGRGCPHPKGDGLCPSPQFFFWFSSSKWWNLVHAGCYILQFNWVLNKDGLWHGQAPNITTRISIGGRQVQASAKVDHNAIN